MGFQDTSAHPASFPHTHTGKSGGQVQPLAKAAKPVLTIRSSREWKVITASRPPRFSRGRPTGPSGPPMASSSLTAMRMA